MNIKLSSAILKSPVAVVTKTGSKLTASDFDYIEYNTDQDILRILKDGKEFLIPASAILIMEALQEKLAQASNQAWIPADVTAIDKDQIKEIGNHLDAISKIPRITEKDKEAIKQSLIAPKETQQKPKQKKK